MGKSEYSYFHMGGLTANLCNPKLWFTQFYLGQCSAHNKHLKYLPKKGNM